jgi:SAM-dependent methyltransferase
MATDAIVQKPAIVKTRTDDAAPVPVPDYLRDVYSWAYLNPTSVRLLDRQWVVNAILWGQARLLQRTLFEELEPGSRVLQMACVYGDVSPRLARRIGPAGRLDVIDVAPVQVENCRRKLAKFPQASVRQADASSPGGGLYDAVVVFFLLHELPETYKRAVVDAALRHVAPGGKAVFVDYHKPVATHPLKWITALVFALLEPFASSLWRHRIADFAANAGRFDWRSETFFGGLFQKTVARASRD